MEEVSIRGKTTYSAAVTSHEVQNVCSPSSACAQRRRCQELNVLDVVKGGIEPALKVE